MFKSKIMKEFNEILTKLKQAETTLAPSTEQEERIARMLFSHEEASPKANFSDTLKLFWTTLQPRYRYLLVMMLLVVILAAPLLTTPQLDRNVGLNAKGANAAPEQLADVDMYASRLFMAGNAEDSTTLGDERAQIRSADIAIEVVDFQKQHLALNSKLEELGGYLVASDVNTYDASNYGNYTVRVPVEKFDEFVNYLRSLGSVLSENIAIADKQNELTQIGSELVTITEEIAVLQAKSSLTSAEQTKLTELLAQKQLLTDQQATLTTETAFSTVSISLSSDSSSASIQEFKDLWTQLPMFLARVALFWSKVLLTLLAIIIATLPVTLPLFIWRKRKSRNTSHLC